MRIGLKGPGAPALLAAQDIPVPASANTWLPLRGDGLVARLGLGEFLVEDSTGAAVARVAAALPADPLDVYPVARADVVLALHEPEALETLAQTCSVDFRAWPFAERRLALTSMAGVSVLVIPDEDGRRYRLWCDPTYAPYLQRTLAEVAGGARLSEPFAPR